MTTVEPYRQREPHVSEEVAPGGDVDFIDVMVVRAPVTIGGREPHCIAVKHAVFRNNPAMSSVFA